MSLGLKRAGIDVVAAFDSWLPAVETYRRNLGGYIRQADLKNIYEIGPALAALAPDIIVGGPPCQDFSVAGERVEGERAGLTRAFAMLVIIARPRWFVMENVPQVRSSIAWKDAQAMLVAAGYGLTESKLNASFYGVPQARKRLFVIGKLGEAHGFLESALVAARSTQPMTVRDMLGGGVGEAFFVAPRMPGRKGIFHADEAAPTICRSSRRPIPPSYRGHPNDAVLLEAGAFYTRPFYDGRGVRTLDEPAPAVLRTTREKPRPKYLSNPHPDDPVPASEAYILSQTDVARIQGFPVGWDWSAATSRDVDQMIANAVPSGLAEAIGRVILARDAGETIPEIQGRFGQWLRRTHGFNLTSVRNVKSRVNRARRILQGRTFADGFAEIAALESSDGFLDLSKAVQSDLRKALRLYRAFLDRPKRAAAVATVETVQVEALAA